jgi:hypothetical protein
LLPVLARRLSRAAWFLLRFTPLGDALGPSDRSSNPITLARRWYERRGRPVR